MHVELNKFLANLTSLEGEEQMESLAALYVLLNWNQGRYTKREVLNLFPHLNNLTRCRIGVGSQKKMAQVLLRLVEHQPTNSSIITPLCSASPKAALKPLLQFAIQHWHRLGDDSQHQVCVAIRNMLWYGRNNKPLPSLRRWVVKYDVRKLIKHATLKVNSPHQLAEIAQSLLSDLELYHSNMETEKGDIGP